MKITNIRNINPKEKPGVIFQDQNLVTGKLLHIRTHREITGGITTTSNRKMDITIIKPTARTINHQHVTMLPQDIDQIITKQGIGYRLIVVTQTNVAKQYPILETNTNHLLKTIFYGKERESIIAKEQKACFK